MLERLAMPLDHTQGQKKEPLWLKDERQQRVPRGPPGEM